MLLIGNGWVVWGGFPSREGIVGCVTMRGAVWVEVFLLLFGEVAFLGLWVTVLGLRWLCLGVTHPRPLFGTGRFGCCFLVGNEWFMVCWFPLSRGEVCGAYLFVENE